MSPINSNNPIHTSSKYSNTHFMARETSCQFLLLLPPPLLVLLLLLVLLFIETGGTELDEEDTEGVAVVTLDHDLVLLTCFATREGERQRETERETETEKN